MIKRELYDEALRLTTLKRISKNEVDRMVEIIRLFNPNYSVCVKCGAQIRHGQRILENWLRREEIIEDVLAAIEPNPEPQLITEIVAEIEVDEVEADKVGCMKCKRKAKTTTTTKTPRTKK